MSWTFRLASLAIGLALAVAIAVALRPPRLDVEVAAATRATLEQKGVDEGRARVRERYTVSAPVAGTLARIDLHEGDLVEPGSVLARLLPLATPLLDPESRKTAEQRLSSTVDSSSQAQATVARARIASDQATRDLARVTALAQGGAISQTQLDQATADARMREAELASASFAAKIAAHEIEQARAALARFKPGASKSEEFEVSSPVGGQVLHVLRRSEGVVAAGTALLELGDPRALELVADVLSQDAVTLKPGMAARVVHWGGEGELSATVRRVEPAAFTKTSALGVDEQRVNVLLDLEGPPASWSALGDGFAVELEITVWSAPDVLQVPTSALFRTGSEWSTFVVDGGVARTRRVAIGHRGALTTEITEGLQGAEIVIIHPGAGVRDGQRVAHR